MLSFNVLHIVGYWKNKIPEEAVMQSLETYQNYFSFRLRTAAEAREAVEYLINKGYSAFRDCNYLWYDKFTRCCFGCYKRVIFVQI